MRFDPFVFVACSLVAVLLPGSAACGGTLVGTVRAEGREAPEDGEGSESYSSRRHRFVERVDYEKMRGFVVYVEGPAPESIKSPEQPVRVVVQQDATFSPDVMAVMVGTVVEWPNEDDIYHNVFSFSEAKPFDLGLYKEEVKRVTFDRPGRVDVFCSIHKNMNCIVLVLENPWFAVADDEGAFLIPDVPPGTYRLTAWHRRLPPVTREVTVTEHGTNTVDFTMGVKGIPEY